MKKKSQRGKKAHKQSTNRVNAREKKPPKGFKAVAGRNGGTLWPAEKGHTMNPNGRPRKFVSTLAKTIGYSQTEVKDCMEAILGMDEKSLRQVANDKSATVLERTIAKALVKGVTNGTLGNLESIITRSFGYPTKEVAVRNTGDKPLATLSVTVVKNGDMPALSTKEEEVDTKKK